MKFGDQLTLTITDIDDKGRGIAAAPSPLLGQVKIPFTAPGDTVEAMFVKRDKGDKIARLVRVVSPSPNRVEAPCPHAGVCGGCLWQHLAYDAQLTLKQNMVNAALVEHGHEEKIDQVQPCPDQFYYRNRMDYVIGWKGEVGLKEFGSWNKYLDLKTCLLLDEKTPTILQTVRDLMHELKLQPWDAKKFEGQMRYVVIRQGKRTGELMITLVVKDKSLISSDQREQITKTLEPLCTSLLIGENPKQTDLSICESFDILKGNLFLQETVNGLTYRIHPNSFFQTNTVMAEQLQNQVLSFVEEQKPKLVLDLYCGLGFFGIACAKRGMMIVGQEIDKQAIEQAKANATLNHVDQHCTFQAGPAEDLSWTNTHADSVILDPPRAGMHPKALKAVLDMAPSQIVYVSCNYHTLVKELKLLKQIYTVQNIVALDLFPNTPHVEVVVNLKKR